MGDCPLTNHYNHYCMQLLLCDCFGSLSVIGQRKKKMHQNVKQGIPFKNHVGNISIFFFQLHCQETFGWEALTWLWRGNGCGSLPAPSSPTAPGMEDNQITTRTRLSQSLSTIRPNLVWRELWGKLSIHLRKRDNYTSVNKSYFNI